MQAVLAALVGALVLAAAEGPPQAAPNPVEAFLRAADVNDFPGMEAIMDRAGPGSSRKSTPVT